MGKMTKMLKLINLLNHRSGVSMETIQKTCNIPERSVYRYLNAASEAQLPVYYDRDQRVYRLSRNGVMRMDDLSFGEAVIATAALHMLANRVNEEYRRDIDSLITKLLVRQPFPVEEILKMVKDGVKAAGANGDLSDLISSVLVHSAVLCTRSVTVQTKDQASGENEFEVERPALQFKRNWRLADNCSGTKKPTRLEDIKRISVA